MCTTQKSDAECGIETLVAKIRIEELLLEQLLRRRLQRFHFGLLSVYTRVAGVLVWMKRE